MTETSDSDAVGADKIDAYIDSVERVLLAASVAKSERLQILEDLELQIKEMLDQQVLPLTEETVADVLSSLEPASHFAAIYGEPGREQQSSAASRSTTAPYNPWVLAAAAGGGFIPLGCLMLMFLAGGNVAGGPVVLVVFLMLIAIIMTPIALHKGFAQLRAAPLRYRGRDLAIATTITYATVVPLLLLALAAAATEGFILFPVAVASFAYFQWQLIRQLRNRIAAAYPAQPHSDSTPASPWRFTPPNQTAPCT